MSTRRRRRKTGIKMHSMKDLTEREGKKTRKDDDSRKVYAKYNILSLVQGYISCLQEYTFSCVIDVMTRGWSHLLSIFFVTSKRKKEVKHHTFFCSSISTNMFALSNLSSKWQRQRDMSDLLIVSFSFHFIWKYNIKDRQMLGMSRAWKSHSHLVMNKIIVVSNEEVNRKEFVLQEVFNI